MGSPKKFLSGTVFLKGLSETVLVFSTFFNIFWGEKIGRTVVLKIQSLTVISLQIGSVEVILH
jgi:hypothetical protein